LKITKEIRTGILVITGLVMTIFSFNYLKGINLFEKSRTFTVVYENVEGLEPSNPVTISGYKIGKVQNINISNDGTNKLEIKLLIDNDVKFSKSSKAELYETGLIGGKAIAIIPDYDDKSIALDGDYLIGTIKPGFTELVNQRLSPLQEKLESAIKNADKVMLTINSVFDNETKNSIQESIRNFKNLSMSLNETTENLHSLISDNSNSINKSLKNIELTSENLSVITENISEVNIKDLINNINSTVTGFNSIITKANNGEGSVSKFLENDAVFNNLENATLELEILINDIKTNPNRYVHFSIFGKKPKKN
jgi:phospholipid/cholesterol/gamma-HCH transport system substrate-binding protein|tara:strand:+ start:9186 stop:10115 length:930 start_codon:yes stop_codon:yes gene_type:complete